MARAEGCRHDGQRCAGGGLAHCSGRFGTGLRSDQEDLCYPFKKYRWGSAKMVAHDTHMTPSFGGKGKVNRRSPTGDVIQQMERVVLVLVS